jgi:hypothetical protein
VRRVLQDARRFWSVERLVSMHMHRSWLDKRLFSLSQRLFGRAKPQGLEEERRCSSCERQMSKAKPLVRAQKALRLETKRLCVEPERLCWEKATPFAPLSLPLTTLIG